MASVPYYQICSQIQEKTSLILFKCGCSLSLCRWPTYVWLFCLALGWVVLNCRTPLHSKPFLVFWTILMFLLPFPLSSFSLFLHASLLLCNGKYFLILVFQLSIPWPGRLPVSEVLSTTKVLLVFTVKLMTLLLCCLWLFLRRQWTSLGRQLA